MIVKVAQSCPTLCDPCMVHGILQARMLEWVAISFPNPGIEPRSPTLQVDSLPAEPQGKSKNTGVSSLSLLQGIFRIQGSSPGLPHFRQILYQLSHEGSSVYIITPVVICRDVCCGCSNPLSAPGRAEGSMLGGGRCCGSQGTVPFSAEISSKCEGW